ncbi:MULTISPECIES: DUF4175 family protein [Flavobacterium]|uniref:ATPase n=1 Tax=Flavobacterium hankyongi TaxID=1176532 RepID=A0ABP8ZNH2_9FLAO|nr:DUF4175 family protein [Flavobacterium sp. N1846]
MNASEVIFGKLEQFIKKFYTNELIRGSIFFVGLGLLYFLFTSFVEYFLWLKPTGRTVLFWLFVLVELFLLGRFIIFPLTKLFRIQKGITYEDASKIIGSHFSNVNDKLINFLQLANDRNQSELLLASIEQKANSLQPIPFTNAIDFNKNKKFIPLAAIPILFIIFLAISGRKDYITESMSRVVNFKQQYTPPAPFSFVVVNNLVTEQNKDFVLKVKTTGKVVPEKALIYINDESYFMESSKPGEFQYTFEKPVSNIDFHIEANEVSSSNYVLNVTTVPAIVYFEMKLNFPAYLHKKTEVIKGTGNAIVPEGTQVSWVMNTVATDKVSLIEKNNSFPFSRSQKAFSLSKNIYENSDYQIVTSNSKVQNYEKLSYSINVLKDQYPTIKVDVAPDTLKLGKSYLLGQLSDDYGLSKLQVVYYPKNNPAKTHRGTLKVKNDVYDQFVFAFPSNLPIEEGIAYEYYFEVYDNDAIHHFKSVKSSVFSHREDTESEKQEQFLENQNQSIQGLEKTLKSQDKQINELEKLQQNSKEKKDLDYKDQQKMNDFLKRQKQQEEMFKEFSDKMKENLEKFNPTEKDPDKELLKERLEKVQKDAEKNQKLLDELKELNNKLEQEELFDRIEKFQQKSKNQTKSLEQLVELTKRYYVEKKASQIADKLEKLAEKQEKLSDSKENSTEKQNEINKEFDDLKKQLDALDKENKELKKPMDIPNDKDKKESIDNDLKNASDQLKKNSPSSASPKQKSAAKKMQQMGQSMQMDMQGGEQEQLEEDVKMLRQILDNLVEVSFSQENLIKSVKEVNGNNASFAKNLKRQQDLKNQFRYVDDSLFAMSLRNPKIGDKVIIEIGNIHYNMDKSIVSFTENQIGRGTSSQQFALTGANTLANLLADILNSMQMQMSGQGQGSPKPGKGQGSGMQLPDIIKKQQGLGEKMQEGNKEGGDKQGEKPGQKPGQKPGEGMSGGQNGGKSGQSGQSQNAEGSDSDGEGNAKQVLDILKEQRQLRESLENELKKHGLTGAGQDALSKMKQIEKQLINKGFTQDVVQKALNLKYDLLNLEEAVQKQNQDNKREGITNKREFQNTAPALPQKLQDYLNSIEILNRQTLPLRSQFNKRVQDYFKEND